jgi:hypothetical protein
VLKFPAGQSGNKLSIFGQPAMEKETFLCDTLITAYNNLFGNARLYKKRVIF